MLGDALGHCDGAALVGELDGMTDGTAVGDNVGLFEGS